MTVVIPGRQPYRKFKNVPSVVDGIRFASKREAHRYCELKLMEKAGEIGNLFLQPRYSLMVDGTKIGEYRADFEYFMKGNGLVTEDVKGVETPLFRWKYNHFQAQYGREIRLVK